MKKGRKYLGVLKFGKCIYRYRRDLIRGLELRVIKILDVKNFIV